MFTLLCILGMFSHCGPTHILAAPSADRIAVEFDSFLRDYDKEYVEETSYRHRLAIFTHNLEFITAFNQNSTSDLRLAINQFADMSAAEFKQAYLSGLNSAPAVPLLPQQDEVQTLSHGAPESVDWRAKGAVTPVKDQRNCGACWAFSTTGSIEGAWFLAGHPLVSLSEQELVDCAAGFRGGCAGGEPSDALNWVQKHGICSNKSYPWTAYQDECHNQFGPCDVTARIAGHTLVQPEDEQALKVAVAKQPVSVQIEADSDVFRFYKSGILTDTGCGTALDHAVLAVGYGTQAGQDYWLVKNSWNASWGDHGYIRLLRGNSTSSTGECGIAMKPMFPVVQGSM